MIKFKQKDFSIKEGHYTGPKDEERVPSTLSLMAKGAGAGALAGTVVGAVIKEIDGKRERTDKSDITLGSGAWSGAKYGALSGVALKLLLNYMHNPMKSIKYQDVDKNLRREFGIYRASGITVGDSVKARASVDEKFGFNDRKVTDYKLTFCISNNRIIMYTFGMSDKELDQVDKVLDYYCKKYYGMEYSSTTINEKMNSYSVHITFTNCQIVANFIMELSNTLETRINLLDNDVIARMKFDDASKEFSREDESRNFSVADINKYQALELLGKPGINLFMGTLKGAGFKNTISNAAIGVLVNALTKCTNNDLTKTRLPMPKFAYENKYLEDVLKKLRYIDGFHYTVRDKTATANISLTRGVLVITVPKGSDDCKKIDKAFWSKVKGNVRRSELNNNVIVYNYSMTNKNEFETYIKMLMSTGIKFNIFE